MKTKDGAARHLTMFTNFTICMTDMNAWKFCYENGQLVTCVGVVGNVHHT